MSMMYHSLTVYIPTFIAHPLSTASFPAYETKCNILKNAYTDQSCKTCSNFLRVKFKVFNLPQNTAFSNSNIYIISKPFKILNRLLIDLFQVISISY